MYRQPGSIRAQNRESVNPLLKGRLVKRAAPTSVDNFVGIVYPTSILDSPDFICDEDSTYNEMTTVSPLHWGTPLVNCFLEAGEILYSGVALWQMSNGLVSVTPNYGSANAIGICVEPNIRIVGYGGGHHVYIHMLAFKQEDYA